MGGILFQGVPVFPWIKPHGFTNMIAKPIGVDSLAIIFWRNFCIMFHPCFWGIHLQSLKKIPASQRMFSCCLLVASSRKQTNIGWSRSNYGQTDQFSRKGKTHKFRNENNTWQWTFPNTLPSGQPVHHVWMPLPALPNILKDMQVFLTLLHIMLKAWKPPKILKAVELHAFLAQLLHDFFTCSSSTLAVATWNS